MNHRSSQSSLNVRAAWENSAWWGALPCIAALMVWWGALQNGFVWDDRILIVENATGLSLSAILRAFSCDFWSSDLNEGRSNYYRPFVTLSYLLDRTLYGERAWGYHLTNVLLHAVNCLLMWSLLRMVGVSALWGALGVTICAVHPVFGESVAWISGRTDSLALCWILCALLAERLERRYPERSARYLAPYGVLAIGSFAAALCSKEIAIVTPLLSYGVARAAGDSLPGARARSFGYIATLGVWLLVRSVVLSGSLTPPGVTKIGFVDGGVLLLHTVGNILLPATYRVEYGAAFASLALLWGALSGCVVLWIALWGSARTLSGQGGSERRVAGWWCVAAGLLFLPSILVVFLKGIVATRLVYAPAMFLIPSLCLIVGSLISRRVFAIVGCGVIVVLAAMSSTRAELWRSDASLFEEALKAPLYSRRVHLNLGIALYDAGRLSEAKRHLEVPQDISGSDQQSYMLGLFFTVLGCEQSAEHHYKRALEVNRANTSASTNLIGVYASQGRREEAEAIFRDLASSLPAESRFLGRVRVNLDRGMRASARAPINRSWCGTPAEIDKFLGSPSALDSRAIELLREGQLEMAGILLKGARLIDPSSESIAVHYAQWLIASKRRTEGLTLLQDTARVHPRSSLVREVLEREMNRR